MNNNQPKQPSEYFTKEVVDKIAKMTDKQMTQKLLQLEQSEFWPAILKYNQARLGVAQSTIFTTDPVKEPAKIAQSQGVMLGVSDLQNAIIQLKFQKEEAEAEAEKEAEVESTDVE